MAILGYHNEPPPLAWDVATAIFGVDGVGLLPDPSNLRTMFQDAAGTIPSLPGDPVRLLLDGRGNAQKFLASNDAQRPTLTNTDGNFALAFDLVNSALSMTLPQAINGDILIAGRKGTIIEPVSYAAGSTFSIGPTTYTGGTPGILRAIGEFVGGVLVDRTLTNAERDQLIAHYRTKGAKGLLVAGPEVAPNTGWPFTSAAGMSVSGPGTVALEDGKIKVTRGASTTHLMANGIPMEVGRSYLIEVQSEPGTTYVSLNNPAFLGSTPLNSAARRKLVAVPTSTSTFSFRFQTIGIVEGSTAYLLGLSVRELRPQEDWPTTPPPDDGFEMTLIQSQAFTNTANVQTLDEFTPEAGSLLVVTVNTLNPDSGGIPTISDSVGGTWTKAGEVSHTDFWHSMAVVYHRVADTADPMSISVSLGNPAMNNPDTGRITSVFQFTGFDPVTPIRQVKTAGGTTGFNGPLSVALDQPSLATSCLITMQAADSNGALEDGLAINPPWVEVAENQGNAFVGGAQYLEPGASKTHLDPLGTFNTNGSYSWAFMGIEVAKAG